MEKVDESERCIVGGDLNGHIGCGNELIGHVHGGHAYGVENDAGEKIIDFSISNDLVIGNSLFRKRDEHLIGVHKSRYGASQIDFLLYRRRDRNEIRNCKVIPGDHVAAQHRLLVIDLEISVTRVHKGRAKMRRKIKWFKLKDELLKQQFSDKVLEEINANFGDVNEWWNRVNEVFLKTGKELLGETSGKIWENKETWWFNADVQEKSRLKKVAKKRYEETKEDTDKEEYKQRCKEAKVAVAIARAEAYDNLYEELDTKEGQGKIFNLAKQRNKSTKDITHIKQIKDEDGRVLREENEILKRWKDYFEKLLNEENPRSSRGEGEPNNEEVSEITRREVEMAMGKMKMEKATGTDDLPIEAWKVLGEDGIYIL